MRLYVFLLLLLAGCGKQVRLPENQVAESGSGTTVQEVLPQASYSYVRNSITESTFTNTSVCGSHPPCLIKWIFNSLSFFVGVDYLGELPYDLETVSLASVAGNATDSTYGLLHITNWISFVVSEFAPTVPFFGTTACTQIQIRDAQGNESLFPQDASSSPSCR